MRKRNPFTSHVFQGVIFLVLSSRLAAAASLNSQHWLWKDFRISQQSMLQESGQVFTLAFDYTPAFRVSRRLWLGLDLGLGAARFVQNPLFPTLEYGLHSYYYLIRDWWAFDSSLGFQDWLNHGGNFAYVGSGMTFRLNRRVLRFVQDFFLHYTYVNSLPRQVHQIRIGIGLTF